MRWLIFFAAALASAQRIAPDTQELLFKLDAARVRGGASASQIRAIREVLLQWVDVRLRNGATPADMNRELDAIRKPATQRDYPGTVGDVTAESVPGADELLAAHLTIGKTCGFDETIVIYQRSPWQRIGVILHDDNDTGLPWSFSSFHVGSKDASGNRLVVTGARTPSCSIPLIGANVRIDRIENGWLHNLLNQDVSPVIDGTSEVVPSAIDGDTVEFRFTRMMRGAGTITAVARYKIAGDKVTQIAPIALSRAGFIDTWFSMTDEHAANWSNPEAAQSRKEADSGMNFQTISRCDGRPAAWEIRLRSSNEAWYLQLAGEEPSQFRVVGLSKQPRAGCAEVGQEALWGDLKP